MTIIEKLVYIAKNESYLHFEFDFDEFKVKIFDYNPHEFFRITRVYQVKSNLYFELFNTQYRTDIKGFEHVLRFIKFNNQLKEFEEYVDTKYEELLLLNI